MLILPNSDTAYEDDTRRIFHRLRTITFSFGTKPNKNLLAKSLITACIEEGLNSKNRIVGALAVLGLNRAHTISVLNNQTGTDSGIHTWNMNSLGKYELLRNPTAPSGEDLRA